MMGTNNYEGDDTTTLKKGSDEHANLGRDRTEQPDVKVIVGGKVFLHYRQILCVASPFFDATLNSRMKEGEESTIYLEDKDPEEWELVSSFFDICSDQKLTEENVERLIPWFHFLGVSTMMNKCDSMFLTMLPDNRLAIKHLLDMCHTSHMYDLQKSTDKSFERLCLFLDTQKMRPGIMDRHIVTSVLSFIKNDDTKYTSELW
eukprot:CAMPEP_0198300300 /NCGR_PEP_ID=MMETSP1449-20131203/47629_1 /TAXON_ID=420275 /ORGANISM="Attheya septentrionalis, Strain CCMP2084" /LENGTH=202 /DNA_ID=CAMNT_0044002077 /DNA_START=46 /DNA_END=651 /DNA_ORIENTATION=+